MPSMSKSLLTISYVFLLARSNFLDQFSVGFPMVVGCTAAYEGPGQKSPDYRASDAEGTLKRRIKIAYIR
jgi:hypothetical protein